MSVTMADWEAASQTYLTAHQAGDGAAQIASIRGMALRLQESPFTDTPAITAMLSRTDERRFVALVLHEVDVVPDELFAPLLRAAIDEVDPSWNRFPVDACLRIAGHRRLVEELLDRLERGSNHEKAGAVNALYWATLPVRILEHGKEVRRVAFPAGMDDLKLRRRVLLLGEFVRNSDVHVRRCIIPSLSLDESAYPEELRAWVPEAIRIARAHSDAYIRQRVEYQLGQCDTTPPLPPRPHA